MTDKIEDSPAETQPDDDDSGFKELLAGIMFAVIGAVAFVLCSKYKMGTALDMGPGYIPRAVSVALIGMGGIGILRGLLKREGPWPSVPVWPLLWVSGAILTFSWLIGRAGLFVTSIVVTLIACMAAPRIHWREIPFVALALAVFCVLLFGYALRLPLPVWPQ